MDKRFDAAVIGTGPAGLSAAITLKLRNKSVLLLGNDEVSDKVSKANEIRNYPGLPQISGQELALRLSEHTRSLGLTITRERITAVYAMGDYFALQSAENTMYEASTVILATGVSFGKPYPGELEFLGRGVSYCATCDAALYRGKNVAVIASSAAEEPEAAFLAEVCEKVYYIPGYAEVGSMPSNVQVVRDEPVKIQGGFKANKLLLKETSLDTDCVFILRESISPAQLVPGLKVEDNHIAVNRKMETNLPGCFACGDVVGTPYQYIKAAGEGNVAALSAVNYLGKIKK